MKSNSSSGLVNYETLCTAKLTKSVNNYILIAIEKSTCVYLKSKLNTIHYSMIKQLPFSLLQIKIFILFPIFKYLYYYDVGVIFTPRIILIYFYARIYCKLSILINL